MRTKIIECRKCGVLNRVGKHSNDVRPICGHCGTPLLAPPFKDDDQRRSNHFFSLLLVFLLGAVCYGIAVTPVLLRKSISRLALEERRNTEDIRGKYEQDLAARKATLEDELAEVDANELRRRAADEYKREIEGRRSYDRRFALSTREKAQLRMLDFASDSAASIPDAIRAVAREASPKGSAITIRQSYGGIALHIDFEMSSMTSGESGTQTKHHTKSSLRREVIGLVSRATNDIFEFCKDLDLSTIHVGCLHQVNARYPDGTTRVESTILYKISIQKNRIRRVASNPFLDAYSTTKYFEVEQDNFNDIEIVTTRP